MQLSGCSLCHRALPKSFAHGHGREVTSTNFSTKTGDNNNDDDAIDNNADNENDNDDDTDAADTYVTVIFLYREEEEFGKTQKELQVFFYKK